MMGCMCSCPSRPRGSLVRPHCMEHTGQQIASRVGHRIVMSQCRNPHPMRQSDPSDVFPTTCAGNSLQYSISVIGLYFATSEVYRSVHGFFGSWGGRITLYFPGRPPFLHPHRHPHPLLPHQEVPSQMKERYMRAGSISKRLKRSPEGFRSDVER